MKNKNWIILIGVAFLALGILIIRPVPVPDEKDCLSLKGKVSEVYESGVNDVAFKLQGLDRTFYINRGLERGLDLAIFRAELANKDVVVLYPKYWTPLDPGNSVRHVSKIVCDGRVVFTEID